MLLYQHGAQGAGEMTKHHKIAGGLTLFALLALAISPLAATSNPASSNDGKRVSIAISSGSHLALVKQQSQTSATGATNSHELSCDHVFRLVIADVGLACTAGLSGRNTPQKVVRLRLD
jgi:hypothetical protein